MKRSACGIAFLGDFWHARGSLKVTLPTKRHHSSSSLWLGAPVFSRSRPRNMLERTKTSCGRRHPKVVINLWFVLRSFPNDDLRSVACLCFFRTRGNRSLRRLCFPVILGGRKKTMYNGVMNWPYDRHQLLNELHTTGAPFGAGDEAPGHVDAAGRDDSRQPRPGHPRGRDALPYPAAVRLH